jgi:hypothetical protein
MKKDRDRGKNDKTDARGNPDQSVRLLRLREVDQGLGPGGGGRLKNGDECDLQRMSEYSVQRSRIAFPLQHGPQFFPTSEMQGPNPGESAQSTSFGQHEKASARRLAPDAASCLGLTPLNDLIHARFHASG